MKRPFFILTILFSCHLIAQKSISGTIVDENNRPIENVKIFFPTLADTIPSINFSDQYGKFQINSFTPHFSPLYFSKPGFFTKVLERNLLNTDESKYLSILLRSRQGFSYDPKQISKKDIGISVSEAIIRYKLDTTELNIIRSPYEYLVGFAAEFSDSSTVCFGVKKTLLKTQPFFSEILNFKIASITIVNTNGKERYYGHKSPNPWGCGNGYYVESKMNEKQN